jgi:hypothetical protein
MGMWVRPRVVLPGLLVPGGGYLAIGAWRQGLAFLSIGLLVAALWTDLFTEFHYGLLLFWSVLCLAAILGADTVSRQSLGESHGVAWIINGAALFVAIGLGLGKALSLAALPGTAGSALAMNDARRLLVIGELAAYGLGGILLGWWAPRPVRTAFWAAALAIAWSFARGAHELGVDATVALVRTRLPHVGGFYGLSLGAATGFALLTSRVARPDLPARSAAPQRVAPPPVTPPREVHPRGPEEASSPPASRDA